MLVPLAALLLAAPPVAAWILARRFFTAGPQFVTDAQVSLKLEELRKSLPRAPQEVAGVALPGASLHIVGVLRRGSARRRQYILDLQGTPGGDLALYLDEGGEITLRVTDAHGNSLGISPPEPPDVFLGQPLYLVAEYGIASDHAMLRIAINGKTVAQQRLPGAGWPWLNGKQVLGSDLCGKNHAAMDLAELREFGYTLGEQQTRAELEYVRNKYFSSVRRFDGKGYTKEAAPGSPSQRPRSPAYRQGSS